MPVSPRFAREVMAALAQLGISQREAAKRSRISPGYVSNMCLGQVPSMGKILQFAGALGIDPAPLLAAAGQPQVKGQTLEQPVIRPFEEPDADVPLFGEVPGGDWRVACQDATERYPVHSAYLAVTDFCLRMVGHSMYPFIQDGDVIGVSTQAEVQSSQVVVARLGEEVTVKRLKIEPARYLLEPFNPMYQPQSLPRPNPDFAVVGVVTWHTHDWCTGEDRVGQQRNNLTSRPPSLKRKGE